MVINEWSSGILQPEFESQPTQPDPILNNVLVLNMWKTQ